MKAASLTLSDGHLDLHQWGNQVHRPINSTVGSYESRRWHYNEPLIGWLCDFLLGKLEEDDCFAICHHGTFMQLYKRDGKLWFRAQFRGYRNGRQRHDFDSYHRPPARLRASPNDSTHVVIDPAVFVQKMKETRDPLVIIRAIKKTQQNRRVRASKGVGYSDLYSDLYRHRYPQ